MITLFCIRPKGFNVGNDVIFMGMQHFIYKTFGEIVNLISLPATSRYESQAKAGLTAKTIYEINQFGHGVIVGGGNLYENGEIEVGLDALKALEVPLMLFSLSRGRIYNRQYQLVDRSDSLPDRLILALNQKAKYSLSRDQATYSYLREIGCDNTQIGGCPTIFLDQMASRLPKLASRDRADVLISIRNPSLMSIPLQKQNQVYNDILQIISFLRGEGIKDIRFLCHDHRDISFAASFSGISFVYTGDVYAYLAMLQSCKLNITYRLHSALPCLSFGTPMINISYDERASSLIQTIGFEDWNIDMIRSTDVVQQVINRYHRLDELPALRKREQPVWKNLYDTMHTAFQAFATDVQAYQALMPK